MIVDGITNDSNEVKQGEVGKEGLDLPKENEGIIETLQEKTKVSVLSTLYRDEGIISQIISIVTRRKIDPSSMIDNLGNARIEFRRLNSSCDSEFE